MARFIVAMMVAGLLIAGLWPASVRAPRSIPVKTAVAAAPMHRSCCKGVCHCCGRKSCCVRGVSPCACCVRQGVAAILSSGSRDRARALPSVLRVHHLTLKSSLCIAPEDAMALDSALLARISPPPELA